MGLSTSNHANLDKAKASSVALLPISALAKEVGAVGPDIHYIEHALLFVEIVETEAALQKFSEVDVATFSIAELEAQPFAGLGDALGALVSICESLPAATRTLQWIFEGLEAGD